VLRTSEPTCSSVCDEDEVGGFLGAIRAEAERRQTTRIARRRAEDE
jgi:hypothetical protein